MQPEPASRALPSAQPAAWTCCGTRQAACTGSDGCGWPAPPLQQGRLVGRIGTYLTAQPVDDCLAVLEGMLLAQHALPPLVHSVAELIKQPWEGAEADTVSKLRRPHTWLCCLFPRLCMLGGFLERARVLRCTCCMSCPSCSARLTLEHDAEVYPAGQVACMTGTGAVTAIACCRGACSGAMRWAWY